MVFSESWDFEIRWIKTKPVTFLKLIRHVTTRDNVASETAVKWKHHIFYFM